jgi:hypothetical protein
MMTHLLSTSTFLEGKDLSASLNKATRTTIDSWQKFHGLWARERQAMRRGSARRAVAVFISLFRRDPGTTAQKFGPFRRRSDLQYRGIPGCNLFAD